MSKSSPLLLAGLASSLLALGCSKPDDPTKAGQAEKIAEPGKLEADKGGEPKPAEVQGPSAEEAKAFVTEVDAKLRELWTAEAQASWTNATDITDEHTAAVAAASEKVMAYIGTVIKDARKFEGVDADPDTKRQLQLLRVATTLPPPDDAAKRKELAELATKLDSMYGTGKWGDCTDPKSDACKDMGDAVETMAKSQDYDELLGAWVGWRTISPPMRPLYQRFVELGNEGARACRPSLTVSRPRPARPSRRSRG
jgi:peptidyl-dipeptidase A